VPYTADKPTRAPSADELRARIPGWGADLDPADRPSVPRERFDLPPTGAHWDLPEQQRETHPRERSIEHARLTPVFGTASPLRGLSGVLRRRAYAYGEARAAHWLILLAADRVDVAETRVAELLHGRAPAVLPTGLTAEASHDGLGSRTGTHRVDVRHQWMDALVTGAPWALAAAGAVAIGRRWRTREAR
jgi:hypothetical protein